VSEYLISARFLVGFVLLTLVFSSVLQIILCPFSFGHCGVCPSVNYRLLISPLVSSNIFSPFFVMLLIEIKQKCLHNLIWDNNISNK